MARVTTPALRYPCLLFDWSGVVFDSLAIALVTVNELFAAHAAPPIDLATFRATWEQPYMRFYNRFLPDLTAAEQATTFHRVYPEVLRRHPAAPCPGMPELVCELAEAGAFLAVISADPCSALDAQLQAFGLAGRFQAILSSCHDKTEAARDLLHRHGIDPATAVIIGDTCHEIAVGQQLGLATVAVTRGYTPAATLAAQTPTHLVATVAELRAALLAGQDG